MIINMALTLTHLFEAALLIVNGLAVLNERRFLRKRESHSLVYLIQSRLLELIPFTLVLSNISDGLDRPAFGEGLAAQIAFLLYAIRTYLRCKKVFSQFLLGIHTYTSINACLGGNQGFRWAVGFVKKCHNWTSLIIIIIIIIWEGWLIM